MTTRRKAIAELIDGVDLPLTVQEICQALDIKSRSLVEEDLGHIAQSVRRKGKVLEVTPAVCTKCGFKFKGRSSMKKPSKCPKCRSEWIIPQQYRIRLK